MASTNRLCIAGPASKNRDSGDMAFQKDRIANILHSELRSEGATVADAIDISGSGEKRRRDPVTKIAVLGGDALYSVASLLRRGGVAVADAEPAPTELSEALAARHGFGFASVRAGSLGHVRQIRQLVEEALTGKRPQNAFWEQPDGTVVDGLRAGVDPCGLPDRQAASTYRQAHLAATRKLLAGTHLVVLCLSSVHGLVDALDGTVYPAPSVGIAVPKTVKLQPVFAKPEALDEDFAALHASLKALNPGIRLRLVVRPAGKDLASCQAEATLRALAATWQQCFADVDADPVFDHLLDRMALMTGGTVEAQRLGVVFSGLLSGEDFVALLATETPAPIASPPLDKAARRERRMNRAGGKRWKAQENAVICEDELLEAFS